MRAEGKPEEGPELSPGVAGYTRLVIVLLGLGWVHVLSETRDLMPCSQVLMNSYHILVGKKKKNEAGKVVWYSYLFQNFPQFIVIHTVKGFARVNKPEIDAFLELSCFFGDPAILAI